MSLRPRVPLIIAFLALAGFALLVGDGVLIRLALGLVIGVALFDAVAVNRQPPPLMSRELPHSLPVNRGAEVTLRLRNLSERTWHLEVTDEVPGDVEVEGLPATLAIPAGELAELRYPLLPKQRGDARFGDIVAMLRSPFGFWERRVRDQQEQSDEHVTETRVYPDFSIIAEYLQMVSDLQLSRAGIRLVRRRGEGLEFHQLRDYRQGDAVRQIDWKATSRRRQLISREYQEERDQQLFFLVDGGRRMRARDGRLSHFDHALNAMLLLSYVALRQGDSVAALTFGGSSRFVAPQRGVGSINNLLNSFYDLQPTPSAADYIGAAEAVLARQRKRAMVVILTNLREEDEDLAPALALLRRRHLVVLANLRERVLDEQAEVEPVTFSDALRVAGVHDYLKRRRTLQQSASGQAHVVLDAVPQELPTEVVNAYWQIKRAGVL